MREFSKISLYGIAADVTVTVLSKPDCKSEHYYIGFNCRLSMVKVSKVQIVKQKIRLVYPAYGGF